MDSIEDFYRARRLKEAFGAAPCSGGLDDWPGDSLDAYDTLTSEENRYDHAKHDADRGGRE